MRDDFQSSKPWAVTVISYGTRGCTSWNWKDPLSRVVTVRRSLLSELLSSTVALGTGSLFTSIAVPMTIPDFSSDFPFCPNKYTGSAKVIATAIVERIRDRLSMCLVRFVSEYMGAGSLPCTLRFALSPSVVLLFDHQRKRTMQPARHPGNR